MAESFGKFPVNNLVVRIICQTEHICVLLDGQSKQSKDVTLGSGELRWAFFTTS